MLFTLNQDPVYKGPDKVLNGQIFYFCNPFTRNRANSVIDCNTCRRSELGTVPRVPCKNDTISSINKD